MAVALVVQKYQTDQNRSLDCTLCDDEVADQQLTTMIFWDQVTARSFCLCAEHMDLCVSAALARHKAELAKKNPVWYLDEDLDPWAEEATS